MPAILAAIRAAHLTGRGVTGDGSRVYGVWFVPRDEADTPVVVDMGSSEDEKPF